VPAATQRPGPAGCAVASEAGPDEGFSTDVLASAVLERRPSYFAVPTVTLPEAVRPNRAGRYMSSTVAPGWT
jgi:hypothetical protein